MDGLVPISNRVLSEVNTVPAYLRPEIVPDVTIPEDWLVVKLPGGVSGYVTAESLK